MEFIDFTQKNFDKALITLLAATIVQTTLISVYLLFLKSISLARLEAILN